jgi:hypothetical protein
MPLAKLTIEEMQKLAISRNGKCLSSKYINNETDLEWECEEGHIWPAPPKRIKASSWCKQCRDTGIFFLRKAQAYAKEKGGKCISKKYLNANLPLEWKCDCGYHWKARYRDLKYYDRWCRKCAGINDYTIEDMQEVAISKGGECLSKEYIRGRNKLLWRCVENHEWPAAAEHIIAGSWCPECAGKKKYTIEKVKEFVEKYGGECLSKEYKDALSNLKFKCKKGHVFDKCFSHIKNNGLWCPECNGTFRYTIDDIQEIAKRRGGKCLSNIYINQKTNIELECSKRHKWKNSAGNIIQGQWCKKCAGLEKKTIHDMDLLAEVKGGKCLSIYYKGNKYKLTWQCADGHIWKAKPNDIVCGSWCSKCNINFNEEKCRFILEHLLDTKFPKASNFLKSKNSYKKNIALELDGYSPHLNLAFEYNGRQHYEYTPFFHKESSDFEYQKERDCLKREACKKRGINLLTIPYTENRNLVLYIKEFLNRNRIETSIDISEIDFSKFNPSKQRIKKLSDIAELRSGKLISKVYNNPFEKLVWECENNHLFLRSANDVKNNNCWCTECN